MTDIPIGSLPAAITPLNSGDFVPIEQAGSTAKATVGDLTDAAAAAAADAAASSASTAQTYSGIAIAAAQHSAGIFQMPDILVGSRYVTPKIVSYDLFVILGVYRDTGELYEPTIPDPTPASNLAKRFIQCAPVTVAGREIQPTVLSYDLLMVEGKYLDTGEGFVLGLSAAATVLDRTAMRVVQTPSGFSVFMPAAADHWTEWVFAHETGTASGGDFDIWHLKGAWDVTLDNYSVTRVQQLLRSDAEFETAIWTTPAGTSNFVGGSTHGGQIQSSIAMLVDGKSTTLAQTADFTAKRIDLYQKSILNSYGTTTKICDLDTRWTFDFSTGSVRIGTTVSWVASPPELRQTYLSGIMPVFRTQGSGPSGSGSAVEIVTTGRRSPLYEAEDLSTGSYSEVDTNAAVMTGYGAGGYSFRLEKTKGWTYPNRASYYAPTVNNKFYQNVYGDHYTPTASQVDEFESLLQIFNPY